MKTIQEMKEREILTTSQRWVGLLIVVGMLLLFGFLVLHQIKETGFFTTEFGSMEKLALFGPILVSLIPPIVRAISGHQNPSRPFDAATNLSLATGSFWLWSVFPFDFTHLADILPIGIHFGLAWVTNDVGKFILLLQVLISPITALSTIWKYFSVRYSATAI